MHSSFINALVFDFGGVLINWDPHRLFDKYFSNNRQAIDDFLAEIDFYSWNLLQDKGYPFKQAIRDLSTQFPQYAHIIQAYDNEWEQSITGIVPETSEILFKLKSAGYPLYGLTNWSEEKFTIVRHKYKEFDLFTDIVVSGEVKLIKPDPAIFHLFLQKNQLKPEECLLVDDSPQNIATAQKMGFFTHYFTTPALLEVELQRLNIL